MLKDIVKNTLLFATVGLAVGFAAPAVGLFIGNTVLGLGIQSAAAAMVPTLTATTFGLFGAFSTALTPAFDAIFDRTSKTNSQNNHTGSDFSPSPKRTIDSGAPIAAHASKATTASFASREDARRENASIAELSA